MAKKTQKQLAREVKEALARPASKPRRVSVRPTPYRIKLTASERDAVEFARGRYNWADMLATHAAEDGSIAFTESEMWQWCDDVDADDGRFSLTAPALSDKLEDFYNSRV
jgi:hypothetical protein